MEVIFCHKARERDKDQATKRHSIIFAKGAKKIPFCFVLNRATEEKKDRTKNGKSEYGGPIEKGKNKGQATKRHSIIFAKGAKKIPFCFVLRDEALKLIEPEVKIVFICIKEGQAFEKGALSVLEGWLSQAGVW